MINYNTPYSGILFDRCRSMPGCSVCSALLKSQAEKENERKGAFSSSEDRLIDRIEKKRGRQGQSEKEKKTSVNDLVMPKFCFPLLSLFLIAEDKEENNSHSSRFETERFSLYWCVCVCMCSDPIISRRRQPRRSYASRIERAEEEEEEDEGEEKQLREKRIFDEEIWSKENVRWFFFFVDKSATR